MGRDFDESTIAHSDTIINWPIKSDFENDIQVEKNNGQLWGSTYITNLDKMYWHLRGM